MRTLVLTLMLTMFVGLPAHAVVVEWLTNGNFEDLSGTFPEGWTIGGAPPGMTSGLAGTANAALMFPDVFGSTLTQSNLEAGPEWTLDMVFASAAPPTADDRSLQFVLNSIGGLINMRVNGDGSVQAFSGTWQDLIPAGVTFSTDSDFDGDFNDPGDVQNVHRLRVVGDFTTTPSYEVMMTAAGSDSFTLSSGAVSVFDGSPVANAGIASVSMRSQASAASYVVDEISLMAEQAPVLPFQGLTNGDFEDVSGTFPNGWTLTRPAITQHEGLGGSTTALFLQKQADGGGRVTQSLSIANPGTEWELDLLFAMEDPGDANARGLNLILNNDPNNGNLNLRVNGDGTVQTVTSIPSTTWIDVPNLSNAVEFSIDGNGDGDFSDPEDTLNVHRLVLQGDYSTASPEYTVFLSEANSMDLLLSGTAANWFTSAPAEGSSIGVVSISAQNSGGNYVVDQVVLRSLAVVPGDYNGDGLVDAADYTVWRDTLGSSVPAGTGADGDASGTIDQADYQFWKDNFGSPSAAAAVYPASVPEPHALVLILCAATCLALAVQRRACGNHLVH